MIHDGPCRGFAGSHDGWCWGCGEDELLNEADICLRCYAGELGDDDLYDADELGLDPEDDDLRRYGRA